jgi:hypothetical protein
MSVMHSAAMYTTCLKGAEKWSSHSLCIWSA